MSKFKYLVLTDLDGTLLNDSGELSQNTIEYVHELNKRDDFMFSFSTGRHWEDSEWIYRKLQLKGYVSCCNGAYIHNPHTGHTRYSFISEFLWETLLSNSEFFVGFVNGDIMSDKGNFVITPGNRLDLLKQLKDLKANLFCIRIYFLRNQGEVDSFDHRINDRLIFLKNLASRPCIAPLYYPSLIGLEVLASYVCKERAVEFVGSFYGVPNSHILTFGDQTNDISICFGVSRSTAVRNAIDFLKQNTSFVSRYTNNEDAVIKEIDLFLKNDK